MEHSRECQGFSQPRTNRAIVLHPFRKPVANLIRSVSSRLEEAIGLANAINIDVVNSEAIKIGKVKAGTYFSSGKIETICATVRKKNVDVVIVDTLLSPVQQRNLEAAWNTKVIDRTGLILEIFGSRAVTREGVLQVELAHLTYQRSRLVRTWTHLERQRGGFGFLGGPGERQIEADRRIISQRITKIERELHTVQRTRKLHRDARSRVPYPIVALVGYTNAGKSSLFNKLTRAMVGARNLLFATLDPTMREVQLPSNHSIILSDTVGFVSDLPTTLIAAFRATLEEVNAADLIIHVRDVSHADTEAQKEDVLEVLEELDIDLESENRKTIEVFNKIDKLESDRRSVIEAVADKSDGIVALSSLTGENITKLLIEIDSAIAVAKEVVTLSIPQANGAAISWLYDNSNVIERADVQEFAKMRVRISPDQLARFQKNYIC